MKNQILKIHTIIQTTASKFEQRPLERITASMTEIDIVVNNAEQLTHKLKTATQTSVTSRVNTADSTIHARAITKAERKINTHDIDLTNMNKLLVDLDETVTRQSTMIVDLTGNCGKYLKL